jgi:hypothetical protein
MGIGVALVASIGLATATPAWAEDRVRAGGSAPALAGASAKPFDTDAFKIKLKKVRGVSILSKIRLAVRINRFARKFNLYHEGKSAKRLAELRRSFDILHASLASLIQPNNPRMHASLMRSREALWRAFAVRGLFYAGFGRDFGGRDGARTPQLTSDGLR